MTTETQAELAELNRQIADKRGWTHHPNSILGDVWSPPNWDKTLGQLGRLPDFTAGDWPLVLLEELADKYFEGSREGNSYFILLQGGRGDFFKPFQAPTLRIAIARAWLAGTPEVRAWSISSEKQPQAEKR